MPPGTSHDLLEDVMDLVKFIDTSLNNKLSGRGVRINPKRLAVGGMSAGAYAAYLAAAHARPRPKALLSIYGMGGNLIVSRSIVSLAL
jgi:dipeptidyl aminopeptidase/acylaminoacyl peptidase